MEIALYNMYSFLWEIETGAVYTMTKANDIYSGLGQQDKLLNTSTATSTTDGNAEGSADANGDSKARIETIEEGDEENEENEPETETEKKDLADILAEECEQANSEKAVAPEASDLPPPPPPPAVVPMINSQPGNRMH